MSVDVFPPGTLNSTLDVFPPSTPAGGSSAPVDATYVVMSLNGTLTNERVLTAGANITITDGGANGPVTIAATAGTSTFDWGKYIAGRGNWPLG